MTAPSAAGPARRSAHTARGRAGALFVVALAATLAACQHESPRSGPASAAPPAKASTVSPAATASAAAQTPFPIRMPASERVVAVGDLHGDLEATRAVLRLAKVLGDDDQWTGGATVLVQTGDILDRGDGERAILALLARLDEQARGAGGRVHVLNGNHELMNVAGDLRYITPGGFAEFAGLPDLDLDHPSLQRVPEARRPRAAAFRPGGPYARKLADHPIVLIVGDTLFVHGGLLPRHVRYGLERFSQESRAWLLGRSLRGRRLVARQDSPVWVRAFSGPPAEVDCRLLSEALAAAKVARMVVGHTIQEHGISSACDERIWRIDVGMGSIPGAKIEALELVDGRAQPLRQDAGAP